MTIRVHLSTSGAGPSSAAASSFATPAIDTEDTLRQVVTRLRTAKRIVVVSGAGVSTAAAIPDFRSASGLFSGKSKGGHSVKDLFHVRCLAHPTLLAKHHELITSLSSLSTAAPPTPFHTYLSSLDNEGRLLRCYTQNIDGLEEKTGLAVGIPSNKRKSPKAKGKENAPSLLSTSDTPETSSEPPEPRVIPLHGLLSTLHCTSCHTTLPLSSHLPLPPTSVPCPTCELASSIRSALSERSRKSGTLRASVVLYGEEHPEGESIGKSVSKDLKGVDMLLVCGTSLSVPGVKRVVKEMAKSAKSKGRGKGKQKHDVKTVFVNEEPPSKGSEWDGIFDIWVQGDVQKFVKDYIQNPEFVSTPARSSPKKASPSATTKPSTSKGTPNTPKKRKPPTTYLPPTPVSLEKDNSSTGSPQIYATPTKPQSAGVASYVSMGLPPTPPLTDEVRPIKRVKVESREREVSPTPTRKDEGFLPPSVEIRG
ncbi:hypothetical protein AYX13_02351 [Cryptococcus neoformans]|nr:hypothetical protein AYX13_02351 [Cryptococcus neoformans var. grubii]